MKEIIELMKIYLFRMIHLLQEFRFFFLLWLFVVSFYFILSELFHFFSHSGACLLVSWRIIINSRIAMASIISSAFSLFIGSELSSVTPTVPRLITRIVSPLMLFLDTSIEYTEKYCFQAILFPLILLRHSMSIFPNMLLIVAAEPY